MKIMIVNYVDSTYHALQKWESWGINMKINGRYEFVGHSWPGSSGEPGKTDRMQLHFSDPNASVKLEKQVKDRGIRIINRVMVTELLKDATWACCWCDGYQHQGANTLCIQGKEHRHQ